MFYADKTNSNNPTHFPHLSKSFTGYLPSKPKFQPSVTVETLRDQPSPTMNLHFLQNICDKAMFHFLSYTYNLYSTDRMLAIIIISIVKICSAGKHSGFSIMLYTLTFIIHPQSLQQYI